MNIYKSIAHMVGTADALALSEHLSAWQRRNGGAPEAGRYAAVDRM